MNIEQFTDSAKQCVSSAFSSAAAKDHQQITPLHLFEGLLADKSGVILSLLLNLGNKLSRMLGSLASNWALKHRI